MADALRKYMEAAAGFTNVTRASAEKLVKNLVKQGGAAAENAQELVGHLVERSSENREALTSIVRSETEKVVKRMGFATQAEVQRLERQVARLRDQAAKAESAPAKKATAKKTTKAAKKTAKKATAKKATAKKSTKKATAKKATKKSSGS